MNFAKNRQEIEITRNKVLDKIIQVGAKVEPRKDIGKFAYQIVNSEVLIDLEYASINVRNEYFFGITKSKYEYYQKSRNFFQLLICDNSDRVFVIPLSFMIELLQGRPIAADGTYKPIIRLQNGNYILRFFGHHNISEYLNRFDFLIEREQIIESPNVKYTAEIEIKGVQERYKLLAELGNLRKNSLHSATVDMLANLGEWYGFEVVKENGLKNIVGFPYKVDCLWYKQGDLYLAIEVCHNGVVEKDKDSLKLAKQHGARKVVLVSEISKVERIRKLFMFNGEIKSWAEVWSFERIFSLYENGLKFFTDFEKFKSYKWNDNLLEYL